MWAYVLFHKKMKHNYSTYIVLGFCLLTSCGQLLPAIYNVNQNKEFASKTAYKDYIIKSTSVDISRFLYLDKDSYHKFLDYIASNNVDYYLGTFINDTLQIAKSKYFEENRSCSGRIIPELDSSLRRNSYDLNTVLKNTSLYYLDRRPAKITDTSKMHVYLIYSYKMGRVHNKDFKSVKDYVDKHSNKFDLFVISIDPYFMYKDLR